MLRPSRGGRPRPAPGRSRNHDRSPACCGPSTAPARRRRSAACAPPARRPMTLASTVTRDVVLRVGDDLGLEQVAEHVDAGPHLGDAVQVLGVQRGRRAADRDDRRRRGRPRAAARRRRPRPSAPARRSPASLRRVPAGIGVAAMGHDAGQARPKRARRPRAAGRHPAPCRRDARRNPPRPAPGRRRDGRRWRGAVSGSSVMTLIVGAARRSARRPRPASAA